MLILLMLNKKKKHHGFPLLGNKVLVVTPDVSY